ncbi:MAG TPA: ThiF family adenylyltransferase [Anaerolineae bacterium]|nr:ThiF family adenylyltransferase [Anaerolineae bacterium]
MSTGDLPEREEPEQDLIVITDPASDRYHTFGFISWWKQEVVREAKVMVIGAGALGNEVLKNLALMGVGHLFIVDFDTIEDANLSRSVLFGARDNGRRKAEVAAEAVKRLNPDVKVQAFQGDVSYDLGLGVFRRMDAIVGCLDNVAARLSINRFCWHLNKPWVDGAIQELLGEARVFRPNDGACYECTLKQTDYEIINLRYSCPLLARADIMQGKVPTTPTISSIVGGIQTQDALKLIHGMDVKAGKGLVFNGLANDAYLTEYQPKEECQSHWVWEDIVELEDCRADSTTVGDLLETVREEMGPETVIELVDGLGRDFVVALECRTCDTRAGVCRPLQQVTLDEGKCPTCGETRHPVMTHRITGDENFLGKTLDALGIPPLHIVAARDGLNYRYFELTGDADTFFDFQ